MDVIIAHLFSLTGDLNALNIDSLFEHFLEAHLSKNRASTIEEHD